MSWIDYKNAVKKHFPFSKEEHGSFWTAVVVLAFVFSFNKWGAEQFDFYVGIGNFLLAFIVSLISLFVHHSIQRLWAIREGAQAEQKLWFYGIIICLMLAIISNGKIIILAATGTFVSQIAVHRLGKFPFGLKYSTMGWIIFAGILGNVVLAAIAKGVETAFLPGNLFLLDIVKFNVMFALYNLLPIPPLDGSRMFFASRPLYVFLFGGILGYLSLLYVRGISSILFASLVGFVFWLLLFVVLPWWRGKK